MTRPMLTKAKRRKIEVALDGMNLNKSLLDAGLVGHTLKEIHIQSPGAQGAAVVCRFDEQTGRTICE